MNITSKITALSRSEKNRKLLGNTASLYVLQGISFIVPLITIPYLIRVLGTNNFGLLAFSGSLIAYFQVIVDYGFNLSATREISIHRNDQNRISNLFCSVFLVKIILVAASCALLTGIIFTIPRFQPDKYLFFWLFASVAGSTLMPTWLFQGLERMAYITIFNLITKVAVTCLYFVFIKTPADYMWFAYLNSGATCIIGLISFIFAIFTFRINLIIPTFADCKKCLLEGFQIFISQASVTLFTNTNTFILGIYANNQIVGSYAVAEKIVRALISMTGPVGAAIYPRISIMFSESQSRAIRFLKKVLISGVIVFGILCCCLFVFSGSIVFAITGAKSYEIQVLIKIMAFLPLTVFIDNIFGTQIMLNANLQKQFMQIIIAGGILSICLLMILIPIFNAYGSAISFVTSQFAILSCMIFTVQKAKIRFHWRN